MQRTIITLIGLGLVSLFSLSAEPCQRGFVSSDRIVTRKDVKSAAYGDFDGDGRADVAFTSSFKIEVALNQGGGVFDPVVEVQPPPGNWSVPIVAATDVDRDGHLDLLFRGSFVIGIARGRGDGSFAPIQAQNLSTPSADKWTLVDFDRDGLLDFVDTYISEIRFLRSQGDGTFLSLPPVRFRSYGYQLSDDTTIGDFDGNGFVDALHVGYDVDSHRWGSSVMWNASTESPTQDDAPLAFEPRSPFVPFDFDGDGGQELFCAAGDDALVVQIRPGTITHRRYPFPVRPYTVLRPQAVMDFDGDGRREFVFTHAGAIFVTSEVAPGLFAEPVSGMAGAATVSIVDLDGDGWADLATRSGSEGLSVVYGGPPRESRTVVPSVLPLEFNPQFIQLADVDRDGQQDVIVNDGGHLTISVWLNEGSGAFRFASTMHYGSPSDTLVGTRVVVADFDGDGLPDLAAGVGRDSPIRPVLAFGDGAGGFVRSSTLLPSGFVIGSVKTAGSPAASLLLQDGLDLLEIRISRAGQTTSPLLTLTEPASVRPLNFDDDGVEELALLRYSTLEIIKRGASGWETAAVVPGIRGSEIRSIVVQDVDGDLASDLMVVLESGVIFCVRNGDGFVLSPTIGAWGFLNSAGLSDVDGDGISDLIITSSHNSGDAGTLQVQRGDGLGHFSLYNTASTFASGAGVAYGDIDGDGRTDILIPTVGGIVIHRNVCITPRVRLVTNPSSVYTGQSFRLVAHALSTDAIAIGGFTVRFDSKIVKSSPLPVEYTHAITRWTSGPLSAGRHEISVEYEDYLAGVATATMVIDVRDRPPRRRSVQP